jgi:ABC-type glutathione transport system ATPase component
VVLARALAALGCSPEPSPAVTRGEPGQAAVLLLDEPTAGLDQYNRQRLLDLVSEVATRHALSLVVVTHELPLARSWGDSLAVLAGGCVVVSGRCEDLFDENGAFVATHPYAANLAVALAAWDRVSGDDTADQALYRA